jgi:hypothetical protein
MFRLSELRFVNGEGGHVVIHLDEKGLVVWSGQFDPHGRHVPVEQLRNAQSLPIQIGEGTSAIKAAMCCRPDGKGGWICKPGPC